MKFINSFCGQDLLALFLISQIIVEILYKFTHQEGLFCLDKMSRKFFGVKYFAVVLLLLCISILEKECERSIK